MRPFLGVELAEKYGVLITPIWLCLVFAFVAGMVAKRFNPSIYTPYLAIAFVYFSQTVQANFFPGRVDHHGLQLICLFLAIYGATDNSKKGGIISAIGIAAGLTIDVYKRQLETPVGDEEDSHLGDFIEDKNTVLPVDAAIQANLRENVTHVLASLTPREERVLRMRFGIGMNTDHTLEEVGQQFSVTRERIRQIEAKALRKLKHPSRSRRLRSFLDN